MLKMKLALVALILLFSVSSYKLYEWGEQARTRATDAEQRLEAAQARLSTIQTRLRKVSSDYATSELRLQQVHSTLTDRPTDRGVYKLLCERGNCAKVDPLPSSGD